MRRFFSFLIYLTASFFIFDTAAQRPRLYASADGLVSGQINDLYQDRQGYLWIATEDGLYRFDGMDFTAFRHRSGDETSISANNAITFLEDAGDRNGWGRPAA